MMLAKTQEAKRGERGFKPSLYHRTPAFDILMQDREREWQEEALLVVLEAGVRDFSRETLHTGSGAKEASLKQ